MNIQIVVIAVACLFVLVICDDLVVGVTNSNHNLIHHTIAVYSAIPYIKRVKNVFYSGQSIIHVSNLSLWKF